MYEEKTCWKQAELPQGLAYRVLLAERGALPAARYEQWQQQRAEVLAQMKSAGIKGSRGLLASLSQKLVEGKNLILNELWSTPATKAFSLTRADALARLEAACLLAWSCQGAALELLFELQGEDSLDNLLQNHFGALLPECEPAYVEALSPRDAELWLAGFEAVAAAAVEPEQEPSAFRHVTVLRQEACEALQAGPGRVLVDATLGGGGHAELLLEAGAFVLGIDQDPMARAAAKARLAPHAERLRVLSGNFSQISDLLAEQGIEQVDGILADIGVSSPQLDCAERGFSFMHEGPLDMRMNTEAPLSAADLVNGETEAALADILWNYGEERASRAIARRIVQQRAKARIETTTQLADIIASVLPRKGKQHPATRSFQALRIAVNDELGALQSLLKQGLALLRPGGRMAIISFHSLEDRAVKRFFEACTKPEIDRPEWPEPRPNPQYCAKLVSRKPLVAGEHELSLNPRARSAKLRVVEKLPLS